MGRTMSYPICLRRDAHDEWRPPGDVPNSPPPQELPPGSPEEQPGPPVEVPPGPDEVPPSPPPESSERTGSDSQFLPCEAVTREAYARLMRGEIRVARMVRQVLTPGNAFGPTREHRVRLAYCMEEEIIERAFDRIEKYFP